MKKRKTSLIRLLLASGLFMLSLVNSEGLSAQDSGPSAQEVPFDPKEDMALAEKLTAYKRAFNRDANRIEALLSAYENANYTLLIENNTKETVKIENCSLFYTMDRIIDEVDIKTSDTDHKKAAKIHDFVFSSMDSSYPLYESKEIHNSPRFLSVYGCGFCDDATAQVVYLADHYGLESRSWWLSGHVVPTIKLDGKERVFDAHPRGLGLIYNDAGEVADIDYIVSLAKDDMLPGFNEEFKTVVNNRTHPNSWLIPNSQPDDPFIELLPGEKRYYFNDLYMVTTDGHYLEEFSSDLKAFISGYQRSIANYIREIPLSHDNVKNGVIGISDYFPFAGVFIVSDDPEFKDTLGNNAIILLDSEMVKQKIWMPAVDTTYEGLSKKYLNLTLGLKNLDHNPSYSIVLANLGHLLDGYKDLKLITVHYYSVRNARFNPKSLRHINKRSGLKYHLK